MSESRVTHGVVVEDADATFLARILGDDGDPVQQADVSAIAAKVYNESNSNTQTYSAVVIVANSVFNALQTDDRWTRDSTGFNFAHLVPYTAFPTGGHRYRVEFKFSLATGSYCFALFQVVATSILGG